MTSTQHTILTCMEHNASHGTTGVACMNTFRNFIGIERDPEYFKIAEARIAAARKAALAKLNQEIDAL
jgi:DNA modification methylase